SIRALATTADRGGTRPVLSCCCASAALPAIPVVAMHMAQHHARRDPSGTLVTTGLFRSVRTDTWCDGGQRVCHENRPESTGERKSASNPSECATRQWHSVEHRADRALREDVKPGG